MSALQLSPAAELLLLVSLGLVAVEALLIRAAFTARSRACRRVAAGASIGLVLAVGGIVGAAYWYFSQWELTF